VAFDGLKLGTSALDADKRKFWPTTILDEASYIARADVLKQQELTRAGARLAQLLQEVLDPRPQSCNPSSPGKDGYIPRASMPDIRAWVSPAPDALSIAQVLDDKIYESTRPLLVTARGQSAAEDDVYDKDQVLDRFLPSIGSPSLTSSARKVLETIIETMERDASILVEPMKRKVCEGGRVRPFVARPGTATCLAPVDLAGHADPDQITFGLAASGAYPSTHATIGIMTGLLLAELYPDKAEAAIARGLEFGQSRVVCGFHYQSDVDAGRLAGAGLLARIKSSDAFQKDLADLRTALGAKP
jgi:acid phosphatase (class A)